MSKKLLGYTLGTLLIALCSSADAQPAKTFKIGYLSAQTDRPERRGGAREIVRRELHTLGYVEGSNTVYEYRFAGNKLERLPRLAEELVGLNVDLLFASSNSAALAAKKATKTIPIVFLGAGDPIALTLVDSLARPGGNVTGITSIQDRLSGKRLEILKEALPKLSRVAVLWNPRGLESVPQWKQSQLASRELGLALHSMEVSSGDQLETAFTEAIKAQSAALSGTRSAVYHEPKTDRSTGGKTSAPGDVHAGGFRG